MKRYRLKHIARNPVVKTDTAGAGRIDLEDIPAGEGRVASTEAERTLRTGEGVAFQAEDVLFGKLRPYLRKSLLCDFRGFCSPELVVLRPNRSVVEPRFLHYVVRSNQFVGWAEANSKGTKMPRTDFEAMGRYEFEVPPLLEQQKIADFLDDETEKIRTLYRAKQQLLVLIKEKRAAVCRAAVSGDLFSTQARSRSSRLPWLPVIPSHWPVVKLSLVSKMGTGHTPSRSKDEYWSGARDIPWLTTSDIERFRDDHCTVLDTTAESISHLGLENSSAVLHPAGTVALSRTASVGFSIIMGRDMATSQDFVTWTCSDRLDPHFLLLCLRAMRTDLQKRLAVGSTHKTIYMPDLQGLRIPLPPLDEQRRAIELAGEMMEQIDLIADLIDRQIPLLQERRDALISAAVAGDLDPSSYRTPATAG